jgi:predicted RNase H-like HicB family nuclease
VNTYADACKSLREAIEGYIDAAAWELRHKMTPLDAIDLAQATASKAVDVILCRSSHAAASM